MPVLRCTVVVCDGRLSVRRGWKFHLNDGTGVWCPCRDLSSAYVDGRVGWGMIRLGVNLDHVATVRQARRTVEPDPVKAAVLAELGGADGITLHLREDRRHIQDHDVRRMQAVIQGGLNLEMAVTPEMLDFACELKPQACCLVPEKRQELTTEGGLDLQRAGLVDGVARLQDHGITVSLFIDPTPSCSTSCGFGGNGG